MKKYKFPDRKEPKYIECYEEAVFVLGLSNCRPRIYATGLINIFEYDPGNIYGLPKKRLYEGLTKEQVIEIAQTWHLKAFL